MTGQVRIPSKSARALRALRSLRFRMIAWFFVPAALILSLVAIVNFLAYRAVTRELILQRDREQVRLQAARISSELQQEFIDPFARLGRRLGALQADAWQSELPLFADQFSSFDAGVLAIDISDSAVVASLPADSSLIGPLPIESALHDQLFFVNTIRPVITDLLLAQGESKRNLAFAAPILNSRGARSGYLVGLLSVGTGEENALSKMVFRLSEDNGQVMLVDGNRRVLYATDGSWIGKLAPDEAWVELAAAGVTGVTLADLEDGSRRVVSYTGVPGTRWGLVLERDWAAATATSTAYSRFLLGLLALGIVLPTAALAVGLRQVSTPVRKLTGAARRIASGHFDERVRVESGDEIENLAESFNVMASELEVSYQALERRVADRTRELAGINAVARAVSQTLEMEQVIETALDAAGMALGSDGGAAYRLSEDGELLEMVSCQGLPAGLQRAVAQLPVGTGASGLAVAEGEVAVYSRQDYPEGALRRAIQQDGIELVVGVPLISQDRVLGAMSLVLRQARPVTADERHMLAAIGVQIGTAMENARLYQQAEEVAAQAERQRLARDLHDAVSQTLFSAKLIADALPKLWERDPARALEKLPDLARLTRGAQAEMRNLLRELRPEVLAEEDPATLMRQLAEAAAARSSADIEVALEIQTSLPAEVHEVVYRVAQEGLNNVVKHAAAEHVWLSLDVQPDYARLVIKDDGQGFDLSSSAAGHLGLRIMRERAQAIGAELIVVSEPGHGTVVMLCWEGANGNG